MTADPADAADWFETALAHYPNANRPYDQARTQLAYGSSCAVPSAPRR